MKWWDPLGHEAITSISSPCSQRRCLYHYGQVLSKKKLISHYENRVSAKLPKFSFMAYTVRMGRKQTYSMHFKCKMQKIIVTVI